MPDHYVTKHVLKTLESWKRSRHATAETLSLNQNPNPCCYRGNRAFSKHGQLNILIDEHLSLIESPHRPGESISMAHRASKRLLNKSPTTEFPSQSESDFASDCIPLQAP
jgi:hypothetical protein